MGKSAASPRKNKSSVFGHPHYAAIPLAALTPVRFATLNNHRHAMIKAGYKNDYSNHYIHSGQLPYKYIRNTHQQVEGYPKLQRLYRLKQQQVAEHAVKPYGSRVATDQILNTLNKWVYNHSLQFDVIMIGALTDNQQIYPLLAQLPIDRLCAKPGFLFIWASTKKITELSRLLNDSNIWTKKFRRSEELIFIPIDKNSPYYPNDCDIPENQLLEEIQWHCWMCITGTVRRSTDKELIHCNVNTDLSIENKETGNSAVPDQIYKVVENFSSSTRRLHIIPFSTGLNKPVKVRSGWVIISPDIIIDNFNPEIYKKDIECVGYRIPLNNEIEQLRPKTPAA
ncbi:Kar4 protein [Martiniozyma asiatica (nom. inval.)]|nr:Kar4 protein [Martiniozyma asiatica]